MLALAKVLDQITTISRYEHSTDVYSQEMAKERREKERDQDRRRQRQKVRESEKERERKRFRDKDLEEKI